MYNIETYKSIEVRYEGKSIVNTNETLKLETTLINLTGKVTYTSLNPDIATVDENGVVTIISEISKYYKSVDNEITIYNEKPIDVPDTGKTMKVVLIVVGTLLIGGGSYLTFKYGKRKEY